MASLPEPVNYTVSEAADNRKKILAELNRVRALHSIQPLVNDDKLNKLAQDSANAMARNDKFQFVSGPYGEIVYAGTGIQGNKDIFENHWCTLGCGVARTSGGKIYISMLYECSGRMEQTAIDLKTQRDKILAEHNGVRALKGIHALTADEALNKAAQELADKMARNNNVEYGGFKYGNWSKATSGTVEDIIQTTYKEGSDSWKYKEMMDPHWDKLGSGVARGSSGMLYAAFFYTGTRVVPATPARLATIREKTLKDHNSYRALHGCPPLALDDKLNKSAQAYAEILGETDIMKHSSGRGNVGENLYVAMLTKGAPEKATLATAAFYDEIKDYDFGNPSFASATGHFTQVVWKACTTLGVGVASARSGNTHVVFHYAPHGNVGGEFKENVPKKK